MLRAVAGVIVGYVVMTVLVVGSLIAAGMSMTQHQMFRPGTFEPSTAWIAMSLITGTIAAIVGGLVCVLIAGRRKPAIALAVVAAVLGALSAVFTMMNTPAPKERTGEASMMEIQQNTRSPAWVAIAFPIIGVIGVLVGSRLKAGKPRQGHPG